MSSARAPSPGLAALALLSLTACGHIAPSPAGTADRLGPLELGYRLTYRTDPHAIDVDVALQGPARDFLFTQGGGVSSVLAMVKGTEQTIAVDPGGRVALPEGTTRLRYRYLISGARRDPYTGAGEPGSIVIAGRAYLIRPRVADRVTATLSVTGADALLPWAPESDGTWRLEGAQLVDSGFHSFGGRRCTADVDGARIEIAVLRGELRVSDAFLCAWIRDSARETLTVRPRFPYRRVAVHLVPGGGDAASPLGLTLWSNPPSLALVVGAGADEPEFQQDWVAVHEMLHLLHPSFMHRSPWISEGLATYYGEVARMRSGRQTPAQGWSALLKGFEKARSQGPHWTLADAEAALQRGVYLPVYWAGAVLMLELDVAIRKATGEIRSLDDALEILGRQGQTAAMEDFQRAVDEAAGRPVFDAVLAPHRSGPVFGDLETLLERLGIRREGSSVEFHSAEDGEIREAIGRNRAGVRH